MFIVKMLLQPEHFDYVIHNGNLKSRESADKIVHMYLGKSK